jgi:hypothetical protein
LGSGYQAIAPESACLQLVVWVEKVLDQWELAVVVFLDVEGALNYTSFDSISAALVRCGVNFTIVQ